MAHEGAESRLLIDGKLVDAEGGRVRQRQPRDRGGHRPRRRRVRARHGARHRRGATGLRRDRLVDESRAPQALPAAAPGRARQGARGAAAADRRRGRGADRPHVRDPAGHLHRRHAVGHRPDRPHRVGVRASRARVLRHEEHDAVLREPIGVVGAITPWNFPFMLNLSKVVPALAAGNTVVLKPAPDTPWSATYIGKIVAEETDCPPGVLNVVTSGDPAAVGEVLTGDAPRRHDQLHRLDRDRASASWPASAGTLKQVFLELGGKSANIVLDDADFAPVLPGMGHGLHARGPGLRDHDPDAAAAVALRRRASRCSRAPFEGVKYGDPTDFANLQGPLINARQRERVLGYIEKGKAEGARLVVGGGRPTQFEQRLLRRADAVRRRRPEFDDRAGGDLRPGAVGDPLRGRRRRGAHREQLALRAVGRGHERVAGPRVRRSRSSIRTGTVCA